jgi:hypothetical protein
MEGESIVRTLHLLVHGRGTRSGEGGKKGSGKVVHGAERKTQETAIRFLPLLDFQGTDEDPESDVPATSQRATGPIR